jgi:hypothetical protein
MYPRLSLPVGKVDEDAAGKLSTSPPADLRTLIEDELELRIDAQLWGIPLMGFPPEELVALEAIQEPGFREAMGHDSLEAPG